MTLQEIAVKLGITFLALTDEDEQGNATEWLRHWENDKRMSVSLHKDLFNMLVNDPTIDNLGLQTEEAEGAKGAYTRVRIIKYTPPKFTLKLA